ncbi:hypothetical protein MIMGU_mgv1a017368mg [Erythranthe guttata]|uniref:Uncharacterized protein n=1 Tax=Erythranthe guttata TaxID=4155 RepID=A0A022PZE9_ERYGU|nr:hypothetical protein MIMGU_mgv1a017368mg [Erythranthe guttata]
MQILCSNENLFHPPMLKATYYSTFLVFNDQTNHQAVAVSDISFDVSRKYWVSGYRVSGSGLLLCNQNFPEFWTSHLGFF